MAYTDIDDPSAFFQCTLYVGNNGTQTVTHGGNSDLQADWIWGKARNDTAHHFLIDSVRGVSKRLKVAVDPEATVNAGITAIGSDSFAVGNDGDFNDNNINYVTWNWKESADAGFDILTYEGTGSIQTEAHNLGVKPDMIMVKNIDSSDPPFNWRVYHSSLGAGVALKLNANDAIADDPGYWGDTEPTSSVFSIKDSGETNNNNQTYIAYLFAAKQGYSKFGSYTGNGNADGPFVFLGFKPAFLIIKKSSNAGNNWYMWDNKRNTSNLTNKYLNPDLNAAEGTANYGYIDFLSNGFKTRATGNTDEINQSGHTFIYMAFAENPFVSSTGVPGTAK